MKKKRTIIAMLMCILLLAGIVCWRVMPPSYSRTLKANWGISLPVKALCEQVYEKDSGASFHGDGVRYHVFSYKYEDYIDLMFAWGGSPEHDNLNFMCGYCNRQRLFGFKQYCEKLFCWNSSCLRHYRRYPMESLYKAKVNNNDYHRARRTDAEPITLNGSQRIKAQAAIWHKRQVAAVAVSVKFFKNLSLIM